MTPTRYRWGALAWLLTLQFFVVETVVQLQAGGYSRADALISELGAGTSPGHLLMNASFVVQGLLIATGNLLLRPALAGTAGRVAPALLAAAGIGVLVVGVFPMDGQQAVHEAGAGLYLVGGGLGLIALAYAVRRRSEALGTALALLGLVGTAMTVFFVAGITSYLGEGGTERAAAYVVPIGLAIAGAGLWRLRDRPISGDRPTRRELREQARTARAEQARERDAALEAAARADRPRSAAGPAGPTPARPAEPADDDFDPDDPWASTDRRG
ncbi:putative membrane protein [Geodermatophilus sabuli]|nr:putative membrane protein [Geodermatophilus sabuli]